MTEDQRRLPPRRPIPPLRRMAMRQVLEAAVTHDRGVRWRWSRRGAVLFASSSLALAGSGAVAYALSRPPGAARSESAAPGSARTSAAQAAAAAAAALAAQEAQEAQAAAAAAAAAAGAATAAIPPVCAASQLSFTVEQANWAMGRVSYPVVIRNESAAACNLYGYPGMQMLTGTRGQLPTQVVRNATMFGLPPEQMVVLKPGQEAFFALSFSDGAGYDVSCPTSARVEITPPNAYTPATITWQITPYPSGNGACGTIQVSYVVAGTPRSFM